MIQKKYAAISVKQNKDGEFELSAVKGKSVITYVLPDALDFVKTEKKPAYFPNLKGLYLNVDPSDNLQTLINRLHEAYFAYTGLELC